MCWLLQLSKLGNSDSVGSIQTAPVSIIQSARSCVSIDDWLVGKDPRRESGGLVCREGSSFLADFRLVVASNLPTAEGRFLRQSVSFFLFLLVWRVILVMMTGSLRNRNPSMRGKSRSLLSAPSPRSKTRSTRNRACRSRYQRKPLSIAPVGRNPT